MNQKRALNILMQNRPNTFTQRGGDTVVLEKLLNGLQKRGVKVTVDLEGREDPAKFDLVHLFNFALPEFTKILAERAHAAGVPFVVTTLYEDIPQFHNQSIALARILCDYVNGGQDRVWYERNRLHPDRISACAPFANSWTATHAAALFPNGSREAGVIRRDYPNAGPTVEVKLGYEVGPRGNAQEFEREYGVKDFVLCVGRFESRKNQLMLLKALEDSELPVVLAGGGFSYQPDYDAAVRKFQRKGKTLILGKLSAEMLANAYAAAKVHVLPSWYELPGLVSLEAAFYGCNVVVTDRGTARDYFGDLAFYCDPAHDLSVLNAVLAAYYAPVNGALKEVVMKNTWDTTAQKTFEEYQRLVPGVQSADASQATQQPPVTPAPTVQALTAQPATTQPPTAQAAPMTVYDLDLNIPEFQEVLERGELAARNKEYVLAHELLAKAERLNPNSVRALRARGAVFLAESSVTSAQQCFERAWMIDPADPKTLSGMGMVEMMNKAPERAYDFFVKALDKDGSQLVAILQLIECSYLLSRFEDLERVLRRYVADHPYDLEIRYCLAGCLFKQQRFAEADAEIHVILEKNSAHAGAIQLKDLLKEELNKPASQTVSPAVSPAVSQPVASQSAMVVETPKAETQIVEPPPGASQPVTNAPAFPATGPMFNNVDSRLNDLEHDKKKRNFQAVLDGCQQILLSLDLRSDQRETAELLQAEVSVLQGDLESAESRYDRLLAVNPKLARALCGKGAIAASRNSWDEARAKFEEALANRPEYDVALAGLGICSSWSKDPDKAWQYYIRATRANPENVRALLGMIELGYTLRRLDEVEQAIKSYLEFHPADLDFLYSLAGCYFAQDKLREANEEISKILMFNPEHKNALELKDLIKSKLVPAGAAALAQVAQG